MPLPCGVSTEGRRTWRNRKAHPGKRKRSHRPWRRNRHFPSGRTNPAGKFRNLSVKGKRNPKKLMTSPSSPDGAKDAAYAPRFVRANASTWARTANPWSPTRSGAQGVDSVRSTARISPSVSGCAKKPWVTRTRKGTEGGSPLGSGHGFRVLSGRDTFAPARRDRPGENLGKARRGKRL